MKLFPQLPRSESVDQLVMELMTLSVTDCRKRRGFSHPSQIYSPTGGAPLSESELRELAAGLTAISERFGYPGDCTDTRSTDASWSEYLHRNLQVTPHEVAKDEVWHFMTCVLVPDLVRWRWDADTAEGPSERWITVRRRGRNCFGRLWWRSEILRLPDAEAPYELVHELKEDEFVQIMERPSLAGNRSLSRSAAKALIEFGKRKEKINRALIFREVQKRLLRLGAYLEFETLRDDKLRSLLSEVFIQAGLALQRSA